MFCTCILSGMLENKLLHCQFKVSIAIFDDAHENVDGISCVHEIAR